MTQAQPRPPASGYPPPPLPYPQGLHLFPVVVEGPEGLKVTLANGENVKPFVYCERRCAAWAYAGDYWVEVRGTRDSAPGRERISLVDSSTIRVRPRERDAESNPTTVGLVLLSSGLALMSIAVWQAGSEDDQQSDSATSSATVFFELGALTTVASIVLLIVGGARDTTAPSVQVIPSNG